MTTFEDATAVAKAGEGHYTAELSAGFSIGHALHGGYLMAVAQRAAVAGSPHAHPVANSWNFLRVPRPGPAEVRVERVKTGRTAAVSRATLVQDDQAVLEGMVTTGTLDPDAVASYSAKPPIIAPVEECRGDPAAESNAGRQIGLAHQMELRFDPATAEWAHGRPGDTLEMSGYFRLRDGSEPDSYVLAVAVDAFPPVVFALGSYGWAPTVELTWHMRAVPAPGWLTGHLSGRLVSDGWFDEEVELWDSTGRLVAQARQLARLAR
ncbi:MAG: thioesterase family protein [Streptosporangiales bacterium]|nr:thioesterase family protein [Streptosporangiales bacterium]